MQFIARLLADADIFNANIMDINGDELRPVAVRSREEIVTVLRARMQPLVATTASRQRIEADSLYSQQVGICLHCSNWMKAALE